MKIVFMGTPDFAVPCLERLIDMGHEVTGVFTQPDKPKGRHGILTPPPVKELAVKCGIPVFQPVRMKDGTALEMLTSASPDLVIVVAYGKILPKEILEYPKYGCINIHASLLPLLRGAAPIQWSILNGFTETGVTSMQMDEGLDTGDMLLSAKIPIGENMNAKFKVAHYAFQGTPYPETFEVYVIANGSETLVRDAAQTSSLMPEWDNVVVDLSAYANQTIKVAIKCISDDAYYFFVDDFSIEAAPTNAEIALTSVTPANGAAIPSGQDITLSGVVTNNGTTLTSYKVAYTVDGGAAVEYTVSEINVANAATHNFTHATPISGLAIGSHTIVVTVSEPNGTADGDDSDNSMTVNITVTAPLAYGCYFEEDPAEEGWSFVDSDNDGNNWTWENSSSTPHMTTYEGIGCIYSASYASVALTPDNWAISPAIQIENGPITVSFYAKGQDADYAAEHFQIYAGTSADVTAMTAVSEEFVATGEYTQYTANLPESYVGQVIYVAIRHFNVSDEFVLVVDNFEVLAYGHVVITDIEENIAESIAVYPNPTSSMVTIANAEGKDIIVVNSLGQVVASIENAAANQTIDVTNFANGTYFVKVDGEVVKLNVVK